VHIRVYKQHENCMHGYLTQCIRMPISIHMHKHTCLPAQESISVSMCVHDARALFKAHTTHACLILRAYICSRARARLSALRSHAGMPNTHTHTHTHAATYMLHTPPDIMHMHIHRQPARPYSQCLKQREALEHARRQRH